MNIERTNEVSRVNAVLNHSAILPYVAPAKSVIDATEIVANPDHWCFLGEGGVWLFLRLCPALYDCHAAVLPEFRGRWVRDAAQECLWRLFAESDALEIIMRPAADNPAAIAGCRMLGAHREFVTAPRMPGRNGGLVAQHVYVLSLCGWLGSISGDDPAAYARFAEACPHKGNPAFRRFWSLSGRTEPCPLQP